MPLPTFTPEQRAAALAKAAEARKARSELLANLKSGKENLADVLSRAKTDAVVGKTRVTQLLRALPGIGTKRAEDLLVQARIDPSRRAGGLTENQRKALLDAVG